MSSDPQPLAAKVSARLCHDVVNPLGAVANGLELLELTGLPQSEELSLVRDSLAEAQARLRFLRLAFGPGGTDQVLSADEMSIALTGRFGKALAVEWTPAPLNRAEAKAICLALMSMETLLPFGGKVRICGQNGQWRVKGSAERMTGDAAVWAALEAAELPEVVPPSMIHFAALCAHLSPDGRCIEMARDENQVTFSLSV